MGVAMLVPVVVCADAVKLSVAPSSSEVVEAGERLTRPGKMGAPAFLPPPHPLTLHSKRIATADHKAFKRNLPMHPSLNLMPTLRREIAHSQRGMNWKTCSVEGGGGISKRRATKAVAQILLVSAISLANFAAECLDSSAQAKIFTADSAEELKLSVGTQFQPVDCSPSNLRNWDAKTRVDDVCNNLL